MEFTKKYDVIIAGAGVAGIAAALECARSGLKTALIEKTILLGGLATTGLVNIYLPLCDGLGNQVLFGIAEELLHLSIEYGPGNIPGYWTGKHAKDEQHRYRVVFSPASFILALDKAVIDAGVDLWLDTLVTEPVMDGNHIAGIVVENKSGRGVLYTAVTIDATGDADIVYRAGAPCQKGENWLSLWAFQQSLERAKRAALEPGKVPLLEPIRIGADADGRGHPSAAPKYDGTDGEQVTHFILEGRRLLREHYISRQNNTDGGRFSVFPVTLPSQAQFRTTRRILGKTSMSAGQDGQYKAASIGLAPDWRKSGPIWEIPYGTLVPQNIKGLLSAGRCISTEGDAWEVMRVIPTAAHTGQVAGIAASQSIMRDIPPDELPVDVVQGQLKIKNIPYHIQDVRKDS
jgi:hypothetical protein